MEIATTRVSSRGQIVIPVEMRKDMKEGDIFILIKKGEDILLRKEKKAVNILSEVDFDWEGISNFADDKLLAKSWLSKEDEEAFAYLQKR